MDPIQIINDGTSISLRWPIATGFALPPIIPFKEVVSVQGNNDKESNAELQARLASGLKEIAAANYLMPVSLQVINGVDSPFVLPIDPLVSLSGKNIVVRRYVSKSEKRGSIKEYFAQDDYDVGIAGVLIADTADQLNVMIQELRTICEQGKNGLSITNDLLNNYLDIHNIIIEEYEFPFTKGAENQAFNIKGYSDDSYDLLVDISNSTQNV